MHEAHRFATRLNSFSSKPEAFWPAGHGKPTPLELAARASKVAGLTDVDLNYPDHLGPDPRATGDAIRNLGLAVNGLAMRYYSNPAFKIGAFTNPDPAVRREAIDLTKRGVDAAREAGCNLMTLWLGQDGFDYAFQADYRGSGAMRSTASAKSLSTIRVASSASNISRTSRAPSALCPTAPRLCWP